jgi:F0F1-type ATP synthase membrane subunit c/vacuolar-type H+-ATPase subunit K
METVIGFTAIAIALLIGLGALGVGIGMACWVAASSKVLLVSRSWRRCCKRRCSLLSHCLTRLR